MAETERDQRTEEATPRKREQMRERGQVARSADVNTAAGLCAAAAGLAVGTERIVRELERYSVRSFRLVDTHHPLEALSGALPVLTAAAVPVVVSGLAIAAVGVAQARTFSLTHALPKAERLDPLGQLGNLFSLRQQALEIGKQIAKLAAISYVVYALLAAAMPMFTVLAATAPQVSAAFVIEIAQKLFVRVGIAFVAIAAFDYFLVHRKFQEDARMTRQEVRDERKQEEVSPELRNRMRRKIRELIKNRSLPKVSQATVVITNPTHFAIALRYVPGTDAAPLVLAKGKDELALRIRGEARRAQVPMVENRPLARALWKQGKVGRPIPVELYRSVAEIIAYVMQLGRSQKREGASS